ncbi:MAG: signal peptidase II [Pirellulales bacterium]|nr:signal peptidase II [Pirellulales bacterium]
MAAPTIAKNRIVIFLSLALAGAGADLWTKSAIFRWRGLPGEKDAWWMVEEHFGIETAVNIGAVFGVGAGKGTLFASLSVIAGIGILIWLFGFKAAHSRWLTVAMGMISGGILGNLYDRLGLWWKPEPGYRPEWKSGVRDWILVRFEGVPLFDPWPNFNIADSLLVVGACMLLIQSFFPVESGKDSAQADPASDSEPQPQKSDE